MVRNSLRAVLIFTVFSGPAFAQSLLCTPSPGGSTRPCEAHHYHLQLYRLDTKTSQEFWGLNGFASSEACEAARSAVERAHQAIAAFIRAKQPKAVAEQARIGPCHCDLTHDRTNAKFLDETQRLRQIRDAEEIKARLRERLLDMDMPAESELIRALVVAPSSFPTAAWPRSVAPPETPKGYTILPSEVTLKDTGVARETARSAAVETQFDLVDVPSPAGAREQAADAAGAPAGEELSVSGTESPGEPEPAVAGADGGTQESPADQFISYETARVNDILRASETIDDEALRQRIFEASMQRLQLLSNLRRIVEGSGARSRLSALTRSATDEAGRIGLIRKLFGEQMAERWASLNPRDAVFEISEAVASDPIAVLRDSSGRFSESDRQRALFMVLARDSAMTSSQEEWLAGVVERLVTQ